MKRHCRKQRNFWQVLQSANRAWGRECADLPFRAAELSFRTASAVRNLLVPAKLSSCGGSSRRRIYVFQFVAPAPSTSPKAGSRQRSAVHRFCAALRMTKVMNTQRRHKAYSDSQPHQFPQSISLGEKCSVLSDLSTQTLACSVRWLGVTSTMTPLPLEYEQLI